MITITEADLRAALGIDPASTFDAAWITKTVAAANAFLAKRRPDLADVTEAADVHFGLLQLATQYYQRRGSDNAAAAGYPDFGPLPALDKDVEMLLGIGRGAAPVIA